MTTNNGEVEIIPYEGSIFNKTFDEVIELYASDEVTKQIHIRSCPKVLIKGIAGLTYTYNISKRKAYSCAVRVGLSRLYHTKKLGSLIRRASNVEMTATTHKLRQILHNTFIYYDTPFKYNDQIRMTEEIYDIICSDSVYLGLEPGQFTIFCVLEGMASAEKLQISDPVDLKNELDVFNEYIEHRFKMLE